MRAIAVLLLMLAISAANDTAKAEPSSSCKQCRDQQQACMANYSGKTCKVEYDICMKSCQRK